MDGLPTEEFDELHCMERSGACPAMAAGAYYFPLEMAVAGDVIHDLVHADESLDGRRAEARYVGFLDQYLGVARELQVILAVGDQIRSRRSWSQLPGASGSFRFIFFISCTTELCLGIYYAVPWILPYWFSRLISRQTPPHYFQWLIFREQGITPALVFFYEITPALVESPIPGGAESKTSSYMVQITQDNSRSQVTKSEQNP
jgi:hypothetical protein